MFPQSVSHTKLPLLYLINTSREVRGFGRKKLRAASSWHKQTKLLGISIRHVGTRGTGHMDVAWV